VVGLVYVAETDGKLTSKTTINGE